MHTKLREAYTSTLNSFRLVSFASIAISSSYSYLEPSLPKRSSVKTTFNCHLPVEFIKARADLRFSILFIQFLFMFNSVAITRM